jgi:hypothetical protein
MARVVLTFQQYFDTTFCGANAGGASWTDWTDCSVKTGFSTCEDYVANVPHAFDDAYVSVPFPIPSSPLLLPCTSSVCDTSLAINFCTKCIKRA